MRTLKFLLLVTLLSGCGAQQRTAGTACCDGPAPGSLSVRMNGQVTTTAGVATH